MRRKLVYGMLGLVALALFTVSRFMCVTGFLRYGLLSDTCPSGTPRLGLKAFAHGLGRGASGAIQVVPQGFFTSARSDAVEQVAAERCTLSLALVAPTGEERSLDPRNGWDSSGESRWAEVVLPDDLKDGLYTLRVHGVAPFDETSVELKLPIFAPAKIHVITDRPLYEPGNVIAYRAALFRARDLVPIGGRAGRWQVTDPQGNVVLEEEASADDFGIVGGTFPLAPDAAEGIWNIRFDSGDASAVRPVKVAPFTLPRFVVEASTDQPFYGRGDQPNVMGEVRYASSAPVQNAQVSLDWTLHGAWPPPPDWTASLPTHVVTDASGRFAVALPEVPGDLHGQATLRAMIRAVDSTGDMVEGQVRILLSRAPLMVDAVTEYGDGLVSGYNNRVFVRITTADGRPRPETRFRIRRAWDPTDTGTEAVTDADSVAQLQLDPGPPTTVIVPAPPVREAARPEPTVAIEATRDLIGSGDSAGEASLGDRVVIDRWLPSLRPCVRFVDGYASTTIALFVRADGQVSSAIPPPGRLGECLSETMREARFGPAARPRALSVLVGLSNPRSPIVTYSVDAIPDPPDWLQTAVGAALLDARRCLTAHTPSTDLPRLLAVHLSGEGGRKLERQHLELEWIGNPAPRHRPHQAVFACIEDITRRAVQDGYAKALRASKNNDEDLTNAFVATIRFDIDARPITTPRPKDTTKLGYEFLVEEVQDEGHSPSSNASSADEASARLFVPPGEIPPLRLRATPSVAKRGDSVEIQLLRGPSYREGLPKKLELTLQHEALMSRPEEEQIRALVDPKTKTAKFTLPQALDGWFTVEWNGARTLIFVPEERRLEIELKSSKAQYSPGDQAKLLVSTRQNNVPTAAAVTLIGVDESLAQLTPLPNAHELDGLRSLVALSEPAFGILDATLLSSGQIRGANAQAAAMLRVERPPTFEDLDRRINAEGETSFDPVEKLTDTFYAIFAEVYGNVQAWEKAAKDDETLTPQAMVKFYEDTLSAREDADRPTTDAYGRRIRLDMLPDDLLALLDPRSVIINGTHLDEDVENWIDYVRRNAP
ncbi:MAG: hypothetical protein IPK13_07395 [Deltaproteobacteria bacterium]|nr:hypothetical protein [Deltaproteobacteria bacterium]